MQVDAVKFLLENGADVNHRVNNLPPLAHAASRPERGPELLRLLIDHGAILTTTARPDCRNVLHCAAAVGSAETIEFLVKEGGMDLEEKCERGCTPLLIAARSGNIKNAEVLLKLGAKPDVVSEDKQTALIYSVFTKDVDAVKFWLQQPNVDVDAQDCHGISKPSPVCCTPPSFIPCGPFLYTSNLLSNRGQRIDMTQMHSSSHANIVLSK
jgi:ankyrin repeat protein